MSSSSTTSVVVSTALAMALIGGGVGFGLHILQNQDLSEEQVQEIGTQLQATNFWDILFGGTNKSSSNFDYAGEPIIIPGTRWGNNLLVQVELNDFHEVTLLVDTGAADIALTQEMAFDLGVLESDTQERIYSTANGTKKQWVSQIDTIRVGEAEHHNVRASYGIKWSGKGDGLLGMSFLKHYVVDINLEQEELRLYPR